MTLIRIPSDITQRAYAARADLARVTTALTGATTQPALCSAEQGLKRLDEHVRQLKSDVRRFKRDMRLAG